MKRAKSAATQPHNNARSGQSQGDRGGRRGGFFTRGLSAHELRHTQHEEETKGATTSTPRPDEPVEPRSPIGRMVHVEEEESSDTEQENENDDMARPLFEHLLVVRNGDISQYITTARLWYTRLESAWYNHLFFLLTLQMLMAQIGPFFAVNSLVRAKTNIITGRNYLMIWPSSACLWAMT